MKVLTIGATGKYADKYRFAGGNSLVLRAVLSREPRSLRQYIYELAGNSSHLVSA